MDNSCALQKPLWSVFSVCASDRSITGAQGVTLQTLSTPSVQQIMETEICELEKTTSAENMIYTKRASYG